MPRRTHIAGSQGNGWFGDVRSLAFIPEADDRLFQVVMIAENAVCGGVEIQMAGVCRGKAEPTDCKDMQQVAMCEDEHLATEHPYPVNHTLGARTDCLQRFSVRTTVLEQTPAWSLGLNLRRAPAFVGTVVPFHQVGIRLRAISKTRQFRRPLCALQWAGENLEEALALQ